MEITKKFEFEMAHLLSNHPALCQNLHGHSYKLFVTVESGQLVNGMIIDFKDLKFLVEDAIISKLDHAFAYNENTDDEFEKEIAEVVKKHNKKYFAFPFRTTCENMANWIFGKLMNLVKDTNITISKITLFETSGSYCECKGYKPI